MTMFCGAMWAEAGSAEQMLRGCVACLDPYGIPSLWSGRVASWNVGLAVVESPSAMPVRTGGGAVVSADASLRDRAALASCLGVDLQLSDSELIGRAYDRWGSELCEHLRGSFAFAVVDPNKGGVLLGRDHVGSRFLAVHERPHAIAFASTALALTGFPGVGHELDEDRLAELAIAAYGTSRTFVKGVQSIAPGTVRWITPDRRTVRRWWIPESIRIDTSSSANDSALALRARFETAVERCVAGDADLGVMLSGGLDSGSVAAVAARHLSPKVLYSYTSVPPPNWSGAVPRGWIADERTAVQALAAREPNLIARFVHVKGLSLLDHQQDLWELGGVPERNPLNMVWFHECLREAAADGVTVLLTGALGNQGFSVDGPLWLAQLARRFRFSKVVQEVRAWSNVTGSTNSAVIRARLLWPLLPAEWRQRRLVRAGADPLTEWLSATAIRPDRLSDLDIDHVLGDVASPHPDGWTRDLSRRLMTVAAQSEMEGAWRLRYGIELRDPTADRELLELTAEQPEWHRRSNGVTRAVCRAAMADVLPPETVNRRTLGAQLPDWLDRMSDGRDEIGAELEAMHDHPASRDVFDTSRLRLLFDSWPDRTAMADQRTIYEYQIALMRSVVLSRYARWFEERGRRVAAGGPAVVVGEPM